MTSGLSRPLKPSNLACLLSNFQIIQHSALAKTILSSWFLPPLNPGTTTNNKKNSQKIYSSFRPGDHLGFKTKLPTRTDKGGRHSDSAPATGSPISLTKTHAQGKRLNLPDPWHLSTSKNSNFFLTTWHFSRREMKPHLTYALDKNKILLPCKYIHQNVSKKWNVPNRNKPFSKETQNSRWRHGIPNSFFFPSLFLKYFTFPEQPNP